MKITIGKTMILTNIIYYVTIFVMMYLYTITDINSCLGILFFVLILLGIISSTIPNVMINIGIEDINAKLSVAQIIIKLIVFFICENFFVDYCIPTIIVISILMCADIVCEKVLLTPIIKAKVTMKEFMLRKKMADTSATEDVSKYAKYNLLTLVLFLNFHRSIYEIVIMLSIVLVTYYLTTNKMLMAISINYRNAAKYVFWILGIVMLTLSYMESTLLYIVLGFYYAAITSFASEREIVAALFGKLKSKRNEKELQ